MLVTWSRRVKDASCLRKMLKKWAGENVVAGAMTLQLHTDSVQLFKNGDNPTSKVFIEVFECLIDPGFTKTA